jgi:TPR repeat protein
VVKAEPTAIAWFQRAAAQGHTAALDELARRGIKP